MSEVVRIEEIVDMDGLLERVGGDEEFLNEIFEIFLEDSKSLLRQLKDDLASNDANAVSRSAHKLKGSISNFVAQGPIYDAAKHLEQLGRTGESSEFDSAFSSLDTHLSSLNLSIEAFIKQGN